MFINKRVETVRLHSGQPITIRRANPNDVDRLMAMHLRVSEASLYLRYLRHTQPTEAEMATICKLPEDEGAAYVAVVDGRDEQIVGYAFFAINSGSDPLRAEPALLIRDDYQWQGLGGALMDSIIRQARQQGVAAFDMVLSASNEGMAKLVRKTGLPAMQSVAYGEREIYLALEEKPAAPVEIVRDQEQKERYDIPA